MNKSTRWTLLLAIATGGAAALYFLSRYEAPEQQPATAIERQEARPPVSESLTRYPVPASGAAAEAEKPLPTLQESDMALQESLSRLFDPNRLAELFILKDMINRFVVTIDNLPRTKLPLRTLPTLPPPGKFLATGKGGEGMEINPDNYPRYAKYVGFLEGMDTRKVAAMYFHFYPLFQEAYGALGYKSAYFNDRLVAVIDDLLAAPEVTGPIKLVQPAVYYKYADPRLEALSSGQKIMIRMGGDNAARVKTKLRELRQAVTGLAAGER